MLREIDLSLCCSKPWLYFVVMAKFFPWKLSKPLFLKKLKFTPCKAEQPLQGMELQEKEALKD